MLANYDHGYHEHQSVYCASPSPSSMSSQCEEDQLYAHYLKCSMPESNCGVVDFSKKLPRKRAVLTNQQANAIFKLRGSIYHLGNRARDRDFTSRSITTSKMFGVSPKAVRDIWNMRTWHHCTQALWTDEDYIQRAEFLKSLKKGDAAYTTSRQTAASKATKAVRSVGRPCGSKDSKPRRPRKSPSLNASSHSDEHQQFLDSFDLTSCDEDMAAVDSTTAMTFDTAKGTLQEDEGYWASAIAAPASSAGFGLDVDYDLRRSYPFFLEIGDEADASQLC